MLFFNSQLYTIIIENILKPSNFLKKKNRIKGTGTIFYKIVCKAKLKDKVKLFPEKGWKEYLLIHLLKNRVNTFIFTRSSRNLGRLHFHPLKIKKYSPDKLLRTLPL